MLKKLMSRGFFSIFSSRSLKVSSLMVKSLIHFQLIFMSGIRIKFYFSTCGYLNFSIQLTEETILSLLNVLGFLAKGFPGGTSGKEPDNAGGLVSSSNIS